LFLLHPTITVMAVVGTANHYWLDGIIACIVLAVAVYLFGDQSPIPWHRANPMRVVRGRRAGDDARTDFYGVIPADGSEHDHERLAPVERAPEECVTGARAAPAPPTS
jgi:hypothetical protein